jgi:putative Flp pilus-assembly TadE/G-like protein
MKAHRNRSKRTEHPCRDQSGNILILFAILMPLFLITSAIVVDVGYWWVNGRKAQIAADACALAAARELPQNWTPARSECVHDGRDYVLTNIPDQGPNPEPKHLSTEVLSPYKGDSSLVEATVDLRVRTFFGRYVGLDWIDLTRRAVAEQQVGDGNYAIYAHHNGCQQNGTGQSLLFNGSHHTINGRVHANGEYRINNNDSTAPYEPFWAAEGTISDPPSCEVISTSPTNGARFGGSSFATSTDSSPSSVSAQVWPAWWTPAELGWTGALSSGDTCDVKGEQIEIKESGGGTVITVNGAIGAQPFLGPFAGGTITTPYVYCAWKSFKINRDNLTATLTALAPEITIDGNDQTLTAHKGNASGKLLFFTVPNITDQWDGSLATGGNPVCNPTPAKDMTLNGNRHKWTGIIFNPCGKAKVNVGGATVGSSPHVTGTILGLEVEINGQDFVMEGQSNFGGTIELALNE